MSPLAPVPMMEPEAPVPPAVVPDYTIRPSLPIRPDSAPDSPYAGVSSGKGHAGKAAIEPADSVFVIGKLRGAEALRIAKVDPHGWVIVQEDVSRPVIYLRLQPLANQAVAVRLYAENGLLVFDRTLHNPGLDSPVEMGYREWPTGLYTLHVQLDDGRKWTKKIRMTAGL